MLKYALLAGAMVVSVPALAQTTPAADQNTPTTDATAPVASQAVPAPMAQPAPAAPTAAQPQTAPADPTAPAPSAQAATPAPADPAATAAQPAAGGDQVAAVVNKEFPTYDKDSNGTLSKTEFTAWMLALKSASDPSVKADDPKTKAWMTQAFTQADSDKSKSVSKDELTNFLAQASKS